MERTLFRYGNSVVVTLPREVIESLGISEGDVVNVEVDRETRQVIITPVQGPAIPGVNQAFDRRVAKFIEAYRPALEELSRR